MAFVNHFYNATTRKYVALFGTIFNKISITRNDLNGNEVQRMIVPIAYGPFQKFLSRITQDPNLNNPSAITLPRMSFEITNMTYDGARKIGARQRISKNDAETENQQSFVWSPTPYNVDFSLYIMTKHAEDATKVVEQIIPFFKPEWTVTVKLIDDLDPIDIPIILNGITNEDLYEGSYEQRRSVLWTLNFTMKCWYFGPTRKKQLIKFTDLDVWSNLDDTRPYDEKINVFPGLTEDGFPTTNPDLTIPYEEIEYDDDWGIVKVIMSNEEEE